MLSTLERGQTEACIFVSSIFPHFDESTADGSVCVPHVTVVTVWCINQTTRVEEPWSASHCLRFEYIPTYSKKFADSRSYFEKE